MDDLSTKIQVPPSVVRKKMAYWQAQGLIEETSTDQFSLIENIEQHARQESGMFTDNLTLSSPNFMYFMLLRSLHFNEFFTYFTNRTSRRR